MIIDFPRRPDTSSLIEDLEEMLRLAREGEVVAIVGYAMTSGSDCFNVTTDHPIVDVGSLAYISLLIQRDVLEDEE